MLCSIGGPARLMPDRFSQLRLNLVASVYTSWIALNALDPQRRNGNAGSAGSRLFWCIAGNSRRYSSHLMLIKLPLVYGLALRPSWWCFVRSQHRQVEGSWEQCNDPDVISVLLPSCALVDEAFPSHFRYCQRDSVTLSDWQAAVMVTLSRRWSLHRQLEVSLAHLRSLSESSHKSQAAYRSTVIRLPGPGQVLGQELACPGTASPDSAGSLAAATDRDRARARVACSSALQWA